MRFWLATGSLTLGLTLWGTIAQGMEKPRDIAWMESSMKTSWYQFFAQRGRSFIPPTIRVHATAEETSCAIVDFAHYCTGTNTIHLNWQILRQIQRERGDGALMFVLAHEYSHAVQESLGILSDEESHFSRGKKRDYNSLTNKELQADCLAGVTFQFLSRHLKNTYGSQKKDAMCMAAFLGDDASTGESHGSPEQRRRSFEEGLRNENACFAPRS